jgi:hypothetical protein
MLVHSRRPSALRAHRHVARGLRAAAGSHRIPVAGFASGLPGNSSIIGEHLARSLMPRLIAPAVAILLFGVGALICARTVAAACTTNANERAGANAFLDPDHLIRISGGGEPLARVGAPFTSSGPATGSRSVFDPEVTVVPTTDVLATTRDSSPARRWRHPNSPAAFFDPPETRSPPVDFRPLSSSSPLRDDLDAPPTRHRGDG